MNARIAAPIQGVGAGIERRVAGWLVVAAIALGACGGGDGPGSDVPPPPVESTIEDSPRFVVIRPVTLQVAPDPEAGAVTTLATGTVLRGVDGEPEPAGWSRVATWDERRGWVEADALVDPAAWGRLEGALGGFPPSELRPAHPVAGGWIVEAPYGSPSLYEGAGAYVLGDSARRARVSGIGTVRSCAGRTHRVALLDGAGGDAELLPEPERVRLVLPAAAPPTLRGLTVEPWTSPDPALVEAVSREATRLYAPPDGIAWWRVEDGSAWASVKWERDGRVEGAFVAVPRPDGAAVDVRAVVSPRSIDEGGRGGNEPTRGPVYAYEIEGVKGPTLFVVSSKEYDEERIVVYLARSRDYGRVWTGFHWGCGA